MCACGAQVLQRAGQAGVCAMVAYTTDFDKADALVRCAKENAGYVYAAVGVHSDNIKRSNEKCVAWRAPRLGARDGSLSRILLACRAMTGRSASRNLHLNPKTLALLATPIRFFAFSYAAQQSLPHHGTRPSITPPHTHTLPACLHAQCALRRAAPPRWGAGCRRRGWTRCVRWRCGRRAWP